MGLGGLGFASCSPLLRRRPASTRFPEPWPLVRTARDRVIRTTAGLRPHRPAGFRVGTEQLGEKTIIHNYGHGGAGISLAWGTGLLATELAVEHPSRNVAVVGAGAVGLATARQLQRRGFQVTVYARDLPPNTTSNMAYAGFTPLSSLVQAPLRTPDWDTQFERAVAVSYKEMQLWAGRGRGVAWVPTYTWTNRLPESEGASPAGGGETETGGIARYELGADLFGPGQHLFPATYAERRATLKIEPTIFLDRLLRDVLAFGGRLRVREFDLAGLQQLDETLIVNCTGLGSRKLFGDETLTPIKGQLTFLHPQPGLDYRLEGSVPGGGRIGVLSRTDGIAIGHLMDRGNWDTEPHEEEIELRLQRVGRLAEFMAQRFLQLGHSKDLLQPAPSWSAPSVPPPVESFFDLES